MSMLEKVLTSKGRFFGLSLASPAPVLIDMAQGLCRQGADLLAMPCNTAHHYHAEIAAAVDVPLPNMAELAATHVAATHPRAGRVGLLASSALRAIRIYEPHFEAVGARVLNPGEERQDALMGLIRAIKAGRSVPGAARALSQASAELEAAGAQCFLVACTELSLVSATPRLPLPVFDAAELLAREVVRRVRG